jgi:hypothetical protein
MSSGSEAGKVFGRFTEQAHQVLDLGRDEAERIGHRYLGPEHLLLGMLHEGASGAGRLLRAHGIGLEAARAELFALAERGVVPVARPSDRALLGTLGIDLEEVRRTTEHAFGAIALGEATWRVTRRRGWRGARVVWTPLCGPPFFAKRALQLAGERASALGHDEVGPELLLLGVVEDAREPAGSPRGSRRHRRIIAHVGLPDATRAPPGHCWPLWGSTWGRCAERSSPRCVRAGREPPREGVVWAACLAAFGLVAAFVTWSAPDTGPAGKPPPTVTLAPGATRPAGLTVGDLGSVQQLQERFNNDQDAPRLVLALAPT